MPGPSRKRPREDSTDEDLESDEGNVSSASSSEDEIEDQLNGEDESTPSIYELKNVWEILNEEADRVYEGDVVEAYIDQVRVGRRLKSDPVHKKVMETMQGLQKRDKDMDFNEALIKAAHRRKHIIKQAAEEAVEDAALIAKEAQGSTWKCLISPKLINIRASVMKTVVFILSNKPNSAGARLEYL